jgi:hypothetical protein
MLKAFSPAYMIVFLFCLGIESPSRRVIVCVLGLCVCTAVASAGEVTLVPSALAAPGSPELQGAFD